jgi:hypothetical protein
MNTVSSPIGHRRWVMLAISCVVVAAGKSVRPMLPANSTSPTKARCASALWNTTWPGVWPGQWRTASVLLAELHLCRRRPASAWA